MPVTPQQHAYLQAMQQTNLSAANRQSLNNMASAAYYGAVRDCPRGTFQTFGQGWYTSCLPPNQ